MSRAQHSTTASLQGSDGRRLEAKLDPAPVPALALVVALLIVLGSAPASAQQQPDAARPADSAAPAAPAAPQQPAAPGAAAATPSPLPAPPLPEALPPSAPPLITKLAPAPVSSSDDFDLLAPAPVFDKAQLAQAHLLEEQLATRRTMLGVHQIAGFVNLAGVATAVVLGQLNYNDKYAGGGDTEKYITAHKVAAYGSAGIFAATGLLALLAPSPIDQPTRLSTATVHKTCMAVATAGMVAEVVLGIVAASKNGSLSQRDFALGHQIIGYTTAVATAGGFIAITW